METAQPQSLSSAHREQPTDDRELIARFQTGDDSAFDQLVRTHQDRLARLVRRLLGDNMEVNDVLQDIFLSVFTGLKRFRADSQFSTWLTSVAINKCRTYARKKRRRRLLLCWLGWAKPDYGKDKHQPSQNTNENAEHLRQAVYRLPNNMREAIVLRYFEKMPVDEIADALKISTGALEVRLTRARKKLKVWLEESG